VAVSGSVDYGKHIGEQSHRIVDNWFGPKLDVTDLRRRIWSFAHQRKTSKCILLSLLVNELVD